jgi:hypothetical protein
VKKLIKRLENEILENREFWNYFLHESGIKEGIKDKDLIILYQDWLHNNFCKKINIKLNDIEQNLIRIRMQKNHINYITLYTFFSTYLSENRLVHSKSHYVISDFMDYCKEKMI